MKFSEDKTPLDESKDKKEINDNLNEIILTKKKIKEKFEKEKNFDNQFIEYLDYIDNFLDIFRPSKIIDIEELKELSIYFPLWFLTFLVIIKFFISKKLTIYYLGILIILPFCSFILIKNIIFEKYFEDFIFSEKIKNLLKDNFRIFIISIFPLILFQYFTLIINISSSNIGIFTNVISIIYSTYIAQKIFLSYIKMIDNNIFDIIINEERNKIILIYLIIYSLINYIINI